MSQVKVLEGQLLRWGQIQYYAVVHLVLLLNIECWVLSLIYDKLRLESYLIGPLSTSTAIRNLFKFI